MQNTIAPKERIHPRVLEKIEEGNSWYIGSQFAWAEKPEIRNIYQGRWRFITSVVSRKLAECDNGPLRVLDAGCGDGYWLYQLNALDNVQVAGLDYNPLRVERAQEVVPGVPVICCDISSYETDERFDVILLSQVLEHVKQDTELLCKLKHMLKKDGVLILGTPNEGSYLHRRRNEKNGIYQETDHVHFYTEPEIKQTLINSGFCVERVMREVFIIGNDRLYYSMTKRWWSFKLLELLTWLWPRECSDLYFQCCRS